MDKRQASDEAVPLSVVVSAGAAHGAGSSAAPPGDGQRSAAEDGAPGSPYVRRAAERETTRQRAKEQRLAERGDRILDALARLIKRWGYGKTTVDDIAREAGVAKGTVYLHWPTKGAMLQALIEREEQQWNADLLKRMASDPRGGTIASLYRHSLALLMQSPLLRALLTQDRDALGEWTRSSQMRARGQRRMEALHALIREMRAIGLMRTDIPVQVQAYLISALSYGILTVDDYLPADLVPPFEQIAAAFATIVRRGFEPELPADEEAAALARGRDLMTALMRALADTASDHAVANGRDAESTADQERTR